MKNIFKSLMIVVLFVGLGSSAFAQTPDNVTGNIAATATVYDVLGITPTAMNFGVLFASTDDIVYLNPHSLASSSHVGEDAIIGTAIIDGYNSASVQVDWTDDVTLTGPTVESVVKTMSLNVEISGKATNVAGDQASSTVLGAYDNATATADISLSTTGLYYLWVGGSLGQLENQEPGVYTGEVVITVSYN